MNQHTKGPWRATLFQGYDKVGIVTADDGRSICSPHWGGMTTEEVNANAALIAAAPDLLEAAKVVLESYACMALEGDSKTIEHLYAAVAKAEE